MAPTLLDDALAEAERAGPGARCVVGLLAVSDAALYAEVVEALASPVSLAAVSRALRGRGVSIAAGSLSRHRNGVCKCR